MPFQPGGFPLIDVDFTVFDRLQIIRPDMVFNIAEGIRGKAVNRCFHVCVKAWAFHTPVRTR